MATIEDLLALDIRVGCIISAEEFPEARNPAYKLTIDFGPDIGVRRSSAQITKHYSLDELPGRLVLGVVNFPPRQVWPFMSEALTLGVPDGEGGCVLIAPDSDVPVGGRMY